MWTQVTRRFESAKQQVERGLRAVRARQAWFDHLAMAYQRYHDQRGDRHAAAVTYFGFLSFLPLLALAFALLGFVVHYLPRARDGVVQILERAFPGLVGPEGGEVHVDRIEAVSTSLGIISLIVLLWTGLGWLSALREALREMWNEEDKGHNLIVGKARDLSTLALIGLVLFVSIGLSSLASLFTEELSNWLGISGGTSELLLRVGLEVVTLATNMAVLIAMFWRLSGAGTSPLRLWQGALIGAIGFELLRVLATFVIARLTNNPVYATFAIAVGLVVWINLLTKVILYSAAWQATRTTDPAAPAPALTRALLTSGRTGIA